MDVWTYFEQKEREFEESSMRLDRDPDMAFKAEAGSKDMRGRVFCNAIMTDNAYLRVSELVEVRGNHAHRLEYAYYLVIDDEEIFAYERDPSHSPAVHMHIEGHERRPAEPISLKDAAEKAWDEVSRRGIA